MKTGKFLKVGNFFITESKEYIVLAIDQLVFFYGIKNENNDYVLIDEPSAEFVNVQMKSLERQYQAKELNTLSQLHHYVLK